jgi:hypothetical protein
MWQGRSRAKLNRRRGLSQRPHNRDLLGEVLENSREGDALTEHAKDVSVQPPLSLSAIADRRQLRAPAPRPCVLLGLRPCSRGIFRHPHGPNFCRCGRLENLRPPEDSHLRRPAIKPRVTYTPTVVTVLRTKTDSLEATTISGLLARVEKMSRVENQTRPHTCPEHAHRSPPFRSRYRLERSMKFGTVTPLVYCPCTAEGMGLHTQAINSL